MARKRKFLNTFMPRVAFTSAKGVQWYEVTWYSKLLTILFCFGAVPAVAFYIGQQFELTKMAINSSNVVQCVVPEVPLR